MCLEGPNSVLLHVPDTSKILAVLPMTVSSVPSWCEVLSLLYVLGWVKYFHIINCGLRLQWIRLMDVQALFRYIFQSHLLLRPHQCWSSCLICGGYLVSGLILGGGGSCTVPTSSFSKYLCRLYYIQGSTCIFNFKAKQFTLLSVGFISVLWDLYLLLFISSTPWACLSKQTIFAL